MPRQGDAGGQLGLPEGPAMTGRRRIWKSLWAIVLVALVIRLILVSFQYPSTLNPRRDHWPFGYEFGRVARSIVSGEGFGNPLFGQTGPTALLPPVYPYMIAGVFKIFGVYTKASAVTILSLQSLFSALTCVPIFFMARRSFGSGTATAAAWTWALFPHAVYLAPELIWNSTLTTLLLAVLVAWTVRLEDAAPRLGEWAGYGLFWGFTALTDPVVLSVLPFLWVWLWYRRRRRGNRWAQPAGVAALALAIALTPWLIRNHRALHAFVPIRDGFWLEMRNGNTGHTSTWFWKWANPGSNEAEMEKYRRMGEIAYITEARREALALIAARPLQFARTTARRIAFVWTGIWSLPRTWHVDMQFDPDQPFDLPNVALYTIFTILALVGIARGQRKGEGAVAPYALVLLSLPLIYYVTHPDLRYRHPMDPEVVVLAVYAVTGWFSNHRRPGLAILAEGQEPTHETARPSR
jgi:Dolichyl-phosphate-mannose-protein mannosyltransferase